jgi:hypothetical protein
MPEAAVYKYNATPTRKNDIRLSWKLLRVQSISIAKAEEEFSDLLLRLRIY